MYNLVEAVNLEHPWRIWDLSGYLILHHARNWIKIPLLRLLVLVSSPGHSREPRRSAVEVILISGLQDHASAWSFGDLLLFLVPESIREIHGLWAPSAMPEDRNEASPGISDEHLVTGTRPWWNAAGDKQQNGKERDGSKIAATIRAANGDGMKWDSSLGRGARPKHPVKCTVLRTWQKTLRVSLWRQKCSRTEPNWSGEEENCYSNEWTATHK